MPESLARTLASSWQLALEDLRVPIGPRIVLVGKGIQNEIESFAMMIGPPLAGSGTEIAVFGSDLTDVGLDEAHAARLPFESDSVDLVVALHAWSDPRDLSPIAAEGSRVLRPGGGLVLGELDVDRLLNSNPAQYGSALLYRTQLDAARRLEQSCVDRYDLEIVLIQLGLLPVRSVPFDRAVAVFETRGDLSAAVAGGHWKMSGELSTEVRESLGATAGAIASAFPYVDEEPWHLVAGSH